MLARTEGERRRASVSVPARRALARLAPRRLRQIGPVACLYVSYGASLGLLGTGAPLALRAAGASLTAIGLVQFIYLPVGLGFLWAPLLDRLRPRRLPHRTGWIVAAQGVMAAVLALLSFGRGWPVLTLGLLAAGVSVAAATTDLSLDALVVETVPENERATVTTAKLVGSTLGTAAGIGLATLMPEPSALPHALLLVAAASVVLSLPILGYPEPPARTAPSLGAARGGVAARVGHWPLLLSRAAKLGAYFAVLLALGAAPGYLLLDLHLPLPTVGLVTGPLGTVLGTAALLSSGALLSKAVFDARQLLLAAGAGVVASSLALLVAAAGGVGWLAAAATLGLTVCSSGLGVPVFATLYRWAEGSQAATDYAVLFGAAFLVSFPARVATPALAAALGWPGFFAVVTPLFVAAVAVLAAAFARGSESAA